MFNRFWINPNKVLTIDKKTQTIRLGGEEISKMELEVLKGEVFALKKMRLWEVLTETLRQLSVEKAVLESTNWEQVLAGKMMLYNLNVQKSIIEIIDKQ